VSIESNHRFEHYRRPTQFNINTSDLGSLGCHTLMSLVEVKESSKRGVLSDVGRACSYIRVELIRSPPSIGSTAKERIKLMRNIASGLAFDTGKSVIGVKAEYQVPPG